MKNYIREKDAADLIKALQLQPISSGERDQLRIQIKTGLDPDEQHPEDYMTMRLDGESKVPWDNRRWYMNGNTLDVLQETAYFAAVFNLSALHIDAETVDLSTFPNAVMRYDPDNEQSRLLREYANRMDLTSLKNWIRKHVYCR